MQRRYAGINGQLHLSGCVPQGGSRPSRAGGSCPRTIVSVPTGHHRLSDPRRDDRPSRRWRRCTDESPSHRLGPSRLVRRAGTLQARGAARPLAGWTRFVHRARHSLCALTVFAVHHEGMESADAWTAWVGYSGGPGGKDHLRPDVRAEVDRRERLREECRGRLLCEVHVRVYEHDVDDGAEMYLVFPDWAVLDPESDPAEVAAAVARAREQLGRWR